jgi:hypothetical protein
MKNKILYCFSSGSRIKCGKILWACCIDTIGMRKRAKEITCGRGQICWPYGRLKANLTHVICEATIQSACNKAVGGERSEDILLVLKEVIQPQVPLRLPCYDFTPVTDPTVVIAAASLRLAHRLKVEPTPMA